jgi:hypothetical protein
MSDEKTSRKDKRKHKSVDDEGDQKNSPRKMKDVPPIVTKKKEKHRSASHTNKKDKLSSNPKTRKNVGIKSPRIPKETKLSISTEQSETRARAMSDTSAIQSIINANKNKIPKIHLSPSLKPSEIDTLIEEDSLESDTEEKSGSSSPDKMTPTSDNKRRSLLFEDGQPIIKAGTMESIVSWLLCCSDKVIILSFLLGGYTTFWTSKQLLTFLQTKFREARKDTSPAGSRDLFKVLDFLCLWMDSCLKRDFLDTKLLPELRNFLFEAEEAGLASYINTIKLLIIKRSGYPLATRLFRDADLLRPRRSVHPGRSRKGSISKKNSKEKTILSDAFTFKDIGVTEFAEQLTWMEFEIFRKIADTELLDVAWVRAKEKAPNVLKMVDMFNKISYWVATQILSESDVKERTWTIRRFINIAEKLFELNNFQSLMEVVAGLSMTAVERLKRSWAGLSSKEKGIFERLCRLLNTKNNFQSYRNTLCKVKLPALPYIGVVLRDFIYIDEGNAEKVENGMINFDKLYLNGLQLYELHRYQQVSVCLEIESDRPSRLRNLSHLSSV